LEKGYLAQLKKRVKRPPQPVVTALPAVQIPKEGASYNPNPESHKELIQEAIEEQLKKRAELEKVLKQLEKVKTKRKRSKRKKIDESEGEEESELETEERENVAHVYRKTRAQRNKQKRGRQIEKALALKRALKDRKVQWDRIRQITSEVEQQQQQQSEHVKAEHERKKNILLTKPRRLGPEKFEELDVEVLLSDQLPSSLRKFNAPYNLLIDRYKSLQRRSIIETRYVKRYNSRYVRKYEKKREHKEFAREQLETYKNL